MRAGILCFLVNWINRFRDKQFGIRWADGLNVKHRPI